MENRLERLWVILENEFGITTLEQLREEISKTKLNIGIFTSEIKSDNSVN